ncbi:MAG: hypothetical protein NW223_23560 [Hyphomicrobiaceae bacterium]|nr:hypothetical protein [Hyphomicrobiaceae bacterium]
MSEKRASEGAFMQLTRIEFWFGIIATFGLCAAIVLLQIVHTH